MVAWVLAVVIALVGVVQLLQGQVIFAVLLFVLAALVGPGGYSIFNRRRRV
ncbi:MAG: GPGG-motif small membrane protein [Acidimicrobiia bacterium]